MNYDYEKLREFIHRCKWSHATSMLTVPHEYIVRRRCALNDEEFLYFVHAQRDLGIHERWGKYNFPYLYIDGYKYWTMGDTFQNTIILNRQKVFNEFDFLDWPLDKYYEDFEMEIMAKTILETFKNEQIFEAGIGNGNFVKKSKIEAVRYYGVDPSKKAISQFRSNVGGFYKKCSTSSFEESIEKWKSNDYVVISLFGSPSYFMRQYLEIFARYVSEYVLMFYREDFEPEFLKEMHQFRYTKNDLREIFKKAAIYTNKNYYIVSSRELKWKKPEPIQNELFPI